MGVVGAGEVVMGGQTGCGGSVFFGRQALVGKGVIFGGADVVSWFLLFLFEEGCP